MNEGNVQASQPVSVPGSSGEEKHELPGDLAASEEWQVRIGQIETVLRFFGTQCSVSIERETRNGCLVNTDTVYVQAQRVEAGIEVEMIGNQFLRADKLSAAQEARMVELGWTAPDGAASPNFSRFLAEDVDIHAFAVEVARAFAEVYGVRADAEWAVSPPEFGNLDAGLASLEAADFDDDEDDDDDDEVTAAEALREARIRILREGSGAQLLSVIESVAVTWDDLIDAGLPRGDKRAEMAMLYRADCPVEFLRKSRFHLEVITDPALPTSTGEAVLAAEPSALEIEKLGHRRDIARAMLMQAALRGAKLANWRARSGSQFLRLRLFPVRRLEEWAKVQDDDAAGMLRHPHCPEDIVLKHILNRSASVRYLALAATKERNLAIDSALIRLAKEVPMTERPNTVFPHADRARKLADAILEAR